MSTAADTAYAAASEIVAQHQPTGTTHLNDHLDYIEFLKALSGEINDLIAGQVAVSRAIGAEWAHIGVALGVSKQAAQQRYR